MNGLIVSAFAMSQPQIEKPASERFSLRGYFGMSGLDDARYRHAAPRVLDRNSWGIMPDGR